MIKLLHLSDTHVHYNGSNDPLFERLAYIGSHYPDHRILITGDVTDDGDEHQYEKAHAMIHNASLCPGNHDYGYLGSLYSKDSAKQFDLLAKTFGQSAFYGKIPNVTLLENVAIIGLNSCKKTKSLLDLAQGEIGWWQRWHLDRLLDKHKGRAMIVMLHHHPFYHDSGMKLEDAEKFLIVIEGRVDILLFGHRHVQSQWYDKSGCKVVLAAGAAFKEETAKELVIEGDHIQIEEVRIL